MISNNIVLSKWILSISLEMKDATLEEVKQVIIVCSITDRCVQMVNCKSTTQIEVVLTISDMPDHVIQNTLILNNSILADVEIFFQHICEIDFTDPDSPDSEFYSLNSINFTLVPSECLSCNSHFTVTPTSRKDPPSYRVRLAASGIYSAACAAKFPECLIAFQIRDSSDDVYFGNCSFSLHLPGRNHYISTLLVFQSKQINHFNLNGTYHINIVRF